MGRTALFSRHQPGGVFTVDDLGEHPGDIYFVDSGSTTTGADSVGYGRNPDAPFLTLDYAVGQCTASQGDTIYCMPGHAETVSAAGGLDLDVIGITVIGLGAGALQPTVTLDTVDTADVDIDAANITVENIHFIAGVADIAAAIDVNACSFTLRNCRMTGDNGGLNALIWVQDAPANGSDRIIIEDCYCMDVDASNTHFVNFAGTGYGHIVRDNILYGDFGTICIGGAGVVTHCTVMNNVIYNESATNDSCINFDATATGIVTGNYAAGGAAQANGFTATAMVLAENYYGVLAEDLSAILDPIAT
ncbi:MAG: hypothetical protein GY841_10380 [FCB group bacterium]|nr:hypothetical protein [FCB group bacterium]